MAERIIGLIVCLLCAFPLFVLGHYGKDSYEPVSFWAGDTSLKKKIKDVKGYNGRISQLYKKCSLVFVFTGVICLINVMAGIVCICLESTLGIYITWRLYKRILSEYV